MISIVFIPKQLSALNIFKLKLLLNNNLEISPFFIKLMSYYAKNSLKPYLVFGLELILDSFINKKTTSKKPKILSICSLTNFKLFFCIKTKKY